MTDINVFLASALEQLQDFKGVQEIFDLAENGKISENEMVASLLALVSEDPELGKKLVELISSEELTTELEVNFQALGFLAQGEDPRFLMKKREHLHIMNPLLQAAWAERIQFDGDLPEFRTGPMNPDATPAVSVLTSSPNFVVVGEQLRKAQEVLTEQLKIHNKELDAAKFWAYQNILEEYNVTEEEYETQTLPVPLKTEITEKIDQALQKLDSAEYDLETYRRGMVPAPLEVPTPTGVQLLSMSPEQKKEAVWKVVSTTQGRRSIKPLLCQHLKESLQQQNYEFCSTPPEEGYSYEFSWTFLLDGKKEMNPNYPYFTIAHKFLLRRLTQQLQEKPPQKPIHLEVQTFDDYGNRKVGWVACLRY